MKNTRRLPGGIVFKSIVTVSLILMICIASDKHSGITKALSNIPVYQVESDKISIPGSCTIFCISYDGYVFFGNNEDFKNPLTYFWVEPPKENKYGILYFGFNDFGPQGGINEKGLAFDGNALPDVKITAHPERQQASESIVNSIIMQKCATVDEAIKMAYSFDWGSLYGGKFAGQYLIADSSGDAAVLGFASDGELVVTRKNKGNGYIVSTNFNLANPGNRYDPYPCYRFNKANAMLKTVKKKDDLTVDFLTSVLDSVHEEGKVIKTLYSNIFDLRTGIVYLYYMHNYNFVCKLDVNEIIKRNPSPQRIKSLFPKNIPEKTQGLKWNCLIWISGIICWIVLIAGSIIIFFKEIIKSHKIASESRTVWTVLLILLGPIALILLLVSRRLKQRDS